METGLDLRGNALNAGGGGGSSSAELTKIQEQIDGILENIQNGFPRLKVQELHIARTLYAYITDGNFYVSGDGAPSILPQFNGQEYFDTTNKVWYKASFIGVEPTASAWKQITNA